MKSARTFWIKTVRDVLSSVSDEELGRAADLYLGHPGAKFVLEILHNKTTPLTSGEVIHNFRCHAYVAVQVDQIKRTVQ